MEDNRIIELFFQRDENAIGHMSEKYGGYCGTIAYNVVENREDTEECLNDTWLNAWKSIPPHAPTCLKAYLGRVVRNIAINIYNKNHAAKRYRAMETMLSELEECMPGAIPGREHIEEFMNNSHLGSIISAWLRGLEEKDRTLFIQRYWYAVPVKALAHSERCTANAMASRMKRLRQQLRTYLENEGIAI